MSEVTLATRSPSKVLFIAGAGGAMLRYRVRHLEEALRSRGVATTALYYRDPRIPDFAESADVVVLYRVPLTWQILRAIDRLRATRPHVPIVFDIDDLVFDEHEVATLPMVRSLPDHDRELFLEGVRRYRATMLISDVVTTSTEAIARAARDLGKPAVVVPNGVGLITLADSLKAMSEPRPADGLVRLGYFSGSRTHDADWALASPAVADLMERDPRVRLVLVGPVDPGPELDVFEGRVVHKPFTSWRKLPRLIRGVDVVLAPLEASRFADAKSAIKWLEAAVVSTPTIASPREAFRSAIDDGVNGFLAEGVDAWAAVLDTAVHDAAARRGVGTAARATALRDFGADRRFAAWLTALEQVSPSAANALPDLRTYALRHDEPAMPMRLERFPFSGETGAAFRLRTGVEHGRAQVASWTVLARRDWRSGGAPAVAHGIGRVAKRSWQTAVARFPYRIRVERRF